MQPGADAQARPDHLHSLVAIALRFRLVFIPGMAVLLTSLYLEELETWRRAGLWLTWLGGGTAFVVEYLLARRHPHRTGAAHVPGYVVNILALQLAAASFTGGTQSFVIPAVPLVGAVAGLWTRSARRATVVSVPVAVWAVVISWADWAGWLPPLHGFQAVPPSGVHLIIRCIGVCGLTLGSTVVAAAVAQAHDRATLETQQARDALLLAQQQRLRAVETLATRVAHELKNPLSAIKGLTQLMLKNQPNRHLEVLESEVQRMQDVLQELLNLGGSGVIHPQPVPLGPVVAQATAVLEGRLREAGCAVRIHDLAPQRAVLVDQARMKQVFINLLLNAVEANARGDIDVTVDAQAQPARVTVADRGQGLTTMQPESLFEDGNTTKAHGSGLGLSVSRAIVRAHGGDLSLAPRDGGGAVATILLPQSNSGGVPA